MKEMNFFFIANYLTFNKENKGYLKCTIDNFSTLFLIKDLKLTMMQFMKIRQFPRKQTHPKRSDSHYPSKTHTHTTFANNTLF